MFDIPSQNSSYQTPKCYDWFKTAPLHLVSSTASLQSHLVVHVQLKKLTWRISISKRHHQSISNNKILQQIWKLRYKRYTTELFCCNIYFAASYCHFVHIVFYFSYMTSTRCWKKFEVLFYFSVELPYKRKEQLFQTCYVSNQPNMYRNLSVMKTL